MIQELLLHDDEQVRTIGILLAEVEECLKSKQITEQDYVDIMADVERLRTIIALKKNLELNQLIHDAVVGIIELAKMVKL